MPRTPHGTKANIPVLATTTKKSVDLTVQLQKTLTCSARLHESLTSAELFCAEKPAGSAPWLALKCSAWSPSRHCNFSSSRRYMDCSPWFLRQMAYRFLHSICPYSPHNNLRLRREVAFTRAHPADCPVRTSRRFSKSRINGEPNPPP